MRWLLSPASVQARTGDAVLALALGALHSLPFVHTWGWALQLVCVAWLAWRVQTASPRRAALLGGLFAFAWLVGGIWWLYVSMHHYGGLPAALAVFAVAALCAFLALYLALAMTLYARWRSGRPTLDALLFAALWLAAEVARGVLLTGFPWLASGYAHVDSPLAALAPWLGVYGVGLAAALAAALLAAGWRQRKVWPVLAVTAALAALAIGGPVGFSRPAGSLTVTLVQTNVAQAEKSKLYHIPAALDWMRGAFLEAKGELVVGPETAVPLLPAQIDALDPGFWPSLRETFGAPGRALLVGTPLGEPERGFTNSVIGLSAAGVYRYDKAHLVPFGEFVPPGFRWFVELWAIPLGDFTAGPLDPASFDFAGQRIAPNICYEDLFGEELARRFRDPATAPSPAEIDTLLGTIERNADRMQRVVGDILELARFRTGQIVLQLRPFEAATMARGAVASLAPLAAQRGQTIELDVPGAPVQVFGDRRRLEQALVNLISNSVKYGPATGMITVRVRPAGRSVAWTVADEGPGIPLHEQPHLFERFFVGQSQREAGGRGVGLGLPTALAIAQAHGGTVDVTSAPGYGSVFSIVI